MNQTPRLPGSPHQPSWAPYLLRKPAAALVFAGASTSILSLLLYMAGMAEFRRLLAVLLIPGLCALAGAVYWAKVRRETELSNRIAAGLWSAVLATFAYDIVRLPIAMGGVPVFKAISYFGTVMLGQPTPTAASEFLGWLYHLSNGVGFGLMYVCLFSRSRWWTAVAWGLLLEGIMLLTPYAEVFGYRISRQFLSITIGAHIVYGLALWGALVFWCKGSDFVTGLGRWRAIVWLIMLISLAGIGGIAADFHFRHGSKIPRSPPEYIGAHLYVTWDVVEPDRVAALWITKRFVDPQARFYFQPSFSRITRGTPFDTPEAAIRRTGTRSATEVLVAQHGLERDPKLARLARMTHLYEITPWLIPSEKEPHDLGQQLKQAMQPANETDVSTAAQRALLWLDGWYKHAMPE